MKNKPSVKIILLINFILFLSLNLYSQKKNYFVDKIYNNLEIHDFIKKVELNKRVSFFFNKDSLPEITINFNKDSIALFEVLKNSFSESKFNVSKFQNNFFITRKKIKSFNKNVLFSINDISSEGVENRPVIQNEKFVNENSDFFIKNITLGDSKTVLKNKICNISGYILNFDNQLPVIGALIRINGEQKVIQSNNLGYFNFKLTQGEYKIHVSSFGFEDQEYKLKIYSEGNLKLYLQKKMYSLDEVIINSTEDNKITNNKIGFDKLSSENIEEIPSLLGEKDIIKTALLLPGVSNVGEGSSGYNVRGSSADQNMFYLSNIPIYNTSHFFGFFSAFNSDAIKEFNIYKSVIPGRYGGKLSSVFEIIPKTGNRKKFSARGGISPITGKILVEGPINKKSSYLAAFRSTYSNWVLKFINYENLNKSRIQFADGIINFSFFINPKNSMKLLTYMSFDNINLFSNVKYRYDNLGSELSWNHFYNKNNYINLSLITSNYSYKEINEENTLTAFSYKYKIHHNELKTDVFVKPLYNYKISFGLNAILYYLDKGDFLPAGDSSIISPTYLKSEYGLESGIYLNNDWDITNKLKLSGIVRMNFYSLLGPAEIFTYGNNILPTEPTLNDTLFFNRGSIIKPSYNPDFRIAFNYIYLKNHSIKFGYNQNHQYIFMLNNTIAISPSDSWKLSDYYIKPMSVNQYTIGFFSNFFKNKIKTSIELYYKSAKNITEFRDGSVLLPPDLIETKILQGNLNAYGIEFMVKKAQGRLNGWINYTYSHTFTKVESPIYEFNINGGEIYPSNYDIPNIINCILNYKFSRRFSVSMNTVYSTGRPVTYPSGVYYLNGIKLLHYSGRNQYRLPDYFRIDLAINIEGNLKNKKIAHSSWSLSVYNVTGRKNAYSIFFKPNKNYIQAYKLSVFGSPIVSVTYNFKLGNYLN